MQVFGHRGAAGVAAENTLSSFRQALALGVDGIEFDVRCSVDGMPVVVHDAVIDRTTSGSGRVQDLTAIELGRWGIPSLAEVLDELGGTIELNVEIKERAACRATLRMLGEKIRSGAIAYNRVLVTSFDIDAVRDIRHLDRQLPIGLLTRGAPPPTFWEITEELSAASANIDLESVNSDFVGQAHQLGLRVMVYTVNTIDDAKRMRDLGVEAIFTDFPNVVRGI